MPTDHHDTYRQYTIRRWQPGDRDAAIRLIATVLAEYGLTCEPTGSDRDAVEVETYYWQTGGDFWVVEAHGDLVGTAGYYPTNRAPQAVEIRKMYLYPQARGQGLGRYLLATLEAAILAQGFQYIWLETASVLTEAVCLYEAQGYQPTTGIETPRCDRVYCKRLIVC